MLVSSNFDDVWLTSIPGIWIIYVFKICRLFGTKWSPTPVQIIIKRPVWRQMFKIRFHNVNMLSLKRIAWHYKIYWDLIRNVLNTQSLFPIENIKQNLDKDTSIVLFHLQCVMLSTHGTFHPIGLYTDFKGNHWLAIPACITVRASPCRDACRDS